MVQKGNAYKRKVFISHTAADKPIADAFVTAFNAAKGEDVCFYSSDGRISIPSGLGVTEAVVEGLKNSVCVVTLLTNNSYKKPWIHFEAGGGFVKSSVIPVLLPGCPDPKELPEFFRVVYHDLRILSEENLGAIYSEICTKHFDATNKESLAKHVAMFVQTFFENIRAKSLYADQVAAVCIRQNKTDTQPKILLIKNVPDAGSKKQNLNPRRHFPKENIWIGDELLSPGVAAAFSALKEAGVKAYPLKSLMTYKHLKHNVDPIKNKELSVIAYEMKYSAIADDESARKNVKERDPQWFTQKQALIEVNKNREKKYSNELQDVIQLAFSNWNKRIGR
jgi:TIR domain